MDNNKDTKRFDDWNVDCNDCEKWWLNQCDGVSRGSQRHCTSFKATRSVVIPEEIKWLKTRLKWLTGAFVVLVVVCALSFLLIAM